MTFVESLKSRRFNSAFVGRDGDQNPLVWEDGSTLQDLGLIVLISDPNISKKCYRVYTLLSVSQKLSTTLKQLYCNTWRFGLCLHLEVANNYLLVKENNQILPFEIFCSYSLLPNHKWYLNKCCLLDLLSLYLQSTFCYLFIF